MSATSSNPTNDSLVRTETKDSLVGNFAWFSFFAIDFLNAAGLLIVILIYPSIRLSYLFSLICTSYYISIYLFIYRTICLSIYLYVYLSIFLSIYLSFCLSIYYLSIFLSICLRSVFLSVFLSIVLVIYQSILEMSPICFLGRIFVENFPANP